MSLLQRVLNPVVDVRENETVTALLMFVYAFLAMTAYNIIQPLTRSRLINSLGAVNVPWVVLGSGLVIGVLMLGYTRIVSILPRRWALPITQAGMAAAMLGFWALFQTGAEWVSVGFYLYGLILGILLISQFWTLANDVYDPRQAKRLFGLIGGGASLGGATGAFITASLVERLGTTTMLLVSAAILVGCFLIVVSIVRTNERVMLGLSVAQLTSVAIVVGGAWILARRPSTPPQAPRTSRGAQTRNRPRPARARS